MPEETWPSAPGGLRRGAEDTPARPWQRVSPRSAKGGGWPHHPLAASDGDGRHNAFRIVSSQEELLFDPNSDARPLGCLMSLSKADYRGVMM